MKLGSVTPTMSVRDPSGRYSFTAMPRPSRSPSWACGLPLPLEKRTVARTGSPCRCAARVSRAASPLGVNTASHTIPFA